MCAAPISSLHSKSVGAVRSASGLASQIKDVTAAAPCPSADRLHSLSLCLSPPCLFLSLRLSVFHVSAGRCCSVSAGPRVELRGAEVSGGGEGTGGPA